MKRQELEEKEVQIEETPVVEEIKEEMVQDEPDL